MVTIWLLLATLKSRRQPYSTTLMKTMPLCPAWHHHRHLLCLFRHYPWMACLRSPSWLGITKERITLQMNWKSILNSLQKISILATQFSGGWANKVNFCTCFSWHTTFYAFLVSILATLIHTTWIWIVCHRFCCHCWKDFLRWVGHHLSPTR